MCSRPAQRPSWRQPNWGHPDHDACGTGFIARLSGPPTHEVLQQALQALERLSHRGGVDADGASGDGAGLLTSLPAAFFRARAAEQNIQLGEKFGVGMLFVPAARVAVNSNSLGQRAFESMPEIWQFFIEPIPTKNGTANAAAKFERSLALLR